MDWIKSAQEIVPWLTSLPVVPKFIISVIIASAAVFLLALIWTPQPDVALSEIVTGCYRRALFTRMHAQLSVDAMFASIGACREILQKQVPNIRRKDLQGTAVELLSTLEGIERHNPIRDENDIAAINVLKLAALHSFRVLATATDKAYPLPDSGKLGETMYFTQEEADAPPAPGDLQNQNAIDPRTGEIASRPQLSRVDG